MDKNFGGVIWTNHAIQRLQERGIKQGDAWATFKRPNQSRYAASKGGWVYYKTSGSEKIEVVAKQNPSTSSGPSAGKWIILSVWSKPIYDSRPKTHNQKLKTNKPDLLERALQKTLGRFRKKH